MNAMDLLERIEAFCESSKADRDKKGGGVRKRRTAYSSGRRELFGMRSKKVVDLGGELKKHLGSLKNKKKGGDSLSHTGFKSKQRWKTYDGRK